MVVLLMLRADCSLLALKPAYLSAYLPAHIGGQMLTLEGKSRSLRRSYTLLVISSSIEQQKIWI